MLRKAYLSILLFLLPVVILAQTQHFSFTSNTGESYSIVVHGATLNGASLDSSDEIGVFTPAGLCVGASVWDGTTPLALVAWKDDSQTQQVDGYKDGEQMSFKIWDKSANQEYDATASYTMGNGTFGDGFAAQLTLQAGGGATESITVIAPNGGEDWQVGTQQEIKWTSANFSGQVKIEYSIDGNASHLDVVNSTDNDGSYLWTVPNTPSTQCVVIISDATDGSPFDISDASFTISSGSPVGEEIFVINTNDAGPGSLREAINQANNTPGRNVIVFQIPKADPGYDADIGVWSILPQSALPQISDGELTIDGYSQAQFVGEDTNPFGPEIQIDGSNAGDTGGFYIAASQVEIMGLIINNFKRSGIYASMVEGGFIGGCYIGVSFDGFAPAANGDVGINLHQSRGIHIAPLDTLPNVISKNKTHGIYMVQSSNNTIVGNIIGLNAIKTDTLGNGSDGIYMMSNCDSNEIVDNFIGGNNGSGIRLLSGTGNTIANNSIGCNREEPEINLGNSSVGIYISSSDNLIMENAIAYNSVYGIQIFGAQAVHNTITRNAISRNGWAGIKNENGGNNGMAAPVLTNATINSVTGTAAPNATVEIFADENNQGAIFLGTVAVDATGNFHWSGEGYPPEFFFTATATDAEGNTSEFSNAIQYSTDVDEASSAHFPNSFSLSQNYPNPFNPETTIQYEIPATGQSHVKVSLKIYNVRGELVRTLVNEEKSPRMYQIRWDGLDDNGLKVSGGFYLYSLIAGNFNDTKKMLLLK